MEKEKEKNEHGQHVPELTINGKLYHWHQEYITGAKSEILQHSTGR